MDFGALFSSFVTLFLVIDPIGTAPLFVALTQGMGVPRRRAIALRACAIAAGILTLFGLFGNAMLDLLGISLPAFRIAGGILLFLIAIDMLFERRSQRRQDRADDEAEGHDPSVFPLATPLVAGPGAMAAMMLLTTQDGATWRQVAETHAMMAAVILMVLAMFLLAPVIERALGRTGIVVVTRLLGMILAALSVQFVIDGLDALGAIPAPP